MCINTVVIYDFKAECVCSIKTMKKKTQLIKMTTM